MFFDCFSTENDAQMIQTVKFFNLCKNLKFYTVLQFLKYFAVSFAHILNFTFQSCFY